MTQWQKIVARARTAFDHVKVIGVLSGLGRPASRRQMSGAGRNISTAF
jgi:hypothetical protein